MTLRRTLGYFLREAAADLWKRRTVNVVSIATIGATLYVLGLFVVLVLSAVGLVSSWADESRMSVYLDDALTDGDRERLIALVVSSGASRGFELVSKEEALARFRREFPDIADLTVGLDANPLPASLEITLDRGATDPEDIEALAAGIERMPGVDGVRYDLAWVRRVRSLLGIVAGGGAALGAILLAAAVITISGVIRLNVLARSDEIEILRLVGATRAFIRGPFLVEGAFQGMAASILAIGMIVMTWVLLASSPWVQSDFVLAVLTAGFLSPWTPAILLATGLAVGLGGSMLSVRRVSASSAS